jgi:hypothetical protein
VANITKIGDIDVITGADGTIMAAPPVERDFTDADFCRFCGVCLPAAERCTHPTFRGSTCPHAEAAAAQANL